MCTNNIMLLNENLGCKVVLQNIEGIQLSPLGEK
jgi:hypothetical protein